MPALGTQTITRLRGTAVPDAYGNLRLSWANPSTLDVPGCSVQPAPGGVVYGKDRTPISVVLSVWAPADADVDDRDRVVYAGRTYAVAGSVQVWGVGSALDHKVIPLQAVED
jgi:hypothetical protein